jgi:hypothetical protein
MRPHDPDSRHASQASEGPATTADVPTAPDSGPRGATGAGSSDAAPSEGRLRVLEEIGSGAMGDVYRAFDEDRGIEVAVKVLRAGSSGEERFRREIQAAARLHHPHIVPVYNVRRHDGRPCYTMRLLRGGTLAAHRQRYQADPRAAVALLEKVCRGVAAAHAEGIVHRDLKPGNVLLDEQGEPLVSDFGMAKVADGLEETRSGHLLGTLPYASPEQAGNQAHRATPASDVWALGVMLYELLTGVRPFVGTPAELSLAILSGRYVPPEQARPGLPPGLAAVVRRCLELRPERRYPNAAELADDLARWLRGETPRPARPRPWALKAGLVGALALALAAPLLTHAPRSGPTGPAGEEAPTSLDLLGPEAVAPRLVCGRGRLSQPAPGQLKVEADDLVLVELLARPPWGSFGLRVTVRDLGDRTARVGAYFAATTERSARGQEHVFLSFGYAEGARLNEGGKPRAVADLALHRYRPRAPGDTGLWLSKPALGDRRFAPAPGTPRRLRLEVTPATTRAWLGADREPFVATFRDPWLLDAVADVGALPPALAWSGPPLPTRGAVGLICNGGAAVFEDVVLEPLRPTD